MSQRIISINGNFELQTANRVIAEINMFNAESDDDILLMVSTYGGHAIGALAVCDAMSRSEAPIITMAVGKSMSAGFIITACGTLGKRLALPNTTLMAHEPLGVSEISTNGLKPIKAIRDAQARLLNERTGMDLTTIEGLLSRDQYMTAEQAKEEGFIDGIIGSRP